jgi:flagellar M-ring protein FliF
VTQTSDKYDPEGRVVRSSQTREETSATNDGKENQVTVGNEIPGGQRQPAPGADNAASRDESRKSEEIVNYEISKTTKTEVLEGGRLNRVSVAVLVDGTYGKNDKGESTYQPRSKEELDQIATLVRSAIGFSQKRGDQVEIVNLRFAETAAAPITEPSGWLSAFQFTKDDIMRAIEMVVMGLLGFVVVFMVVRPLVRRIITPDQRPVPALPAGGMLDDSLPIDPGLAPIPAIASGEPLKSDPNQTSKMIDLAQVQGQVHAQSVQKVGEIADKNPGETVSIIRQWLHESASA